jgi:hypothetical protein
MIRVSKHRQPSAGGRPFEYLGHVPAPNGQPIRVFRRLRDRRILVASIDLVRAFVPEPLHDSVARAAHTYLSRYRSQLRAVVTPGQIEFCDASVRGRLLLIGVDKGVSFLPKLLSVDASTILDICTAARALEPSQDERVFLVREAPPAPAAPPPSTRSEVDVPIMVKLDIPGVGLRARVTYDFVNDGAMVIAVRKRLNTILQLADQGRARRAAAELGPIRLVRCRFHVDGPIRHVECVKLDDFLARARALDLPWVEEFHIRVRNALHRLYPKFGYPVAESPPEDAGRTACAMHVNGKAPSAPCVPSAPTARLADPLACYIITT